MTPTVSPLQIILLPLSKRLNRLGSPDLPQQKPVRWLSFVTSASKQFITFSSVHGWIGYTGIQEQLWGVRDCFQGSSEDLSRKLWQHWKFSVLRRVERINIFFSPQSLLISVCYFIFSIMFNCWKFWWCPELSWGWGSCIKKTRAKIKMRGKKIWLWGTELEGGGKKLEF
jgi:hypothetical protein